MSNEDGFALMVYVCIYWFVWIWELENVTKVFYPILAVAENLGRKPHKIVSFYFVNVNYFVEAAWAFAMNSVHNSETFFI